MTDDPDHTWSRITGELRHRVPADTYDIWLAPLRLIQIDDSEVVVEAPSELRAWVIERFARVLQASAVGVLGPGAVVRIRGREEGPPTTARHARGEQLPPTAPSEEPGTGLNPKYRFEQFVIGDANRFAHAAALAVAELPGQAYNPLFIYGPPGVGKTHLLHSIGNYVQVCGGGLSVRYTTVETFTNQFIAAVSGGSMHRFKGRFRHNDVLLIDDVQFLASKAKTEEEFFHTFNALYEAGSQLVLTSDRMPCDLDTVEDRLRERFESGLVTAIGPPDLATRVTVLRKRAQHDGIDVADDEALTVIAEGVRTNIRALEGALIRVVAFASLTGRPVSAAVAGEVLAELYPPGTPPPGTGRPPTIERIQELTAAAFGLTRDQLVSHSRRAQVAWPRQIAMYLAREHTEETLPAIAAQFGGRNHTTVLHACKRTAERIAADPDAFDAVRRLTEQLAARQPDRCD